MAELIDDYCKESFNTGDWRLVEMKDAAFAKWLRKQGWEGEYRHLAEVGSVAYTLYHIGNYQNLALVRTQNAQPIDRWIFVNPAYWRK
jgi:hypothetical protein